MKNRYPLTLILTLAIAVVAQAQIPNASFEDWTSGAPDGWTVSNVGDFISVLESDDAHEGAKSTLMTVDNQAGFDVGGFMTVPSFPHNSVEGSLTGWYKPNFQGGDILSITCTLTDQDQSAVAAGVGSVTGTDNVWTSFQVGLITVTQNDVTAGTISLQIANADGGVFATPNSECLVDELAFGGAVGIAAHEQVSQTMIENVFPNPAEDLTFVQYLLPQSAKVSIVVFDMSGKEVMQVLNLNQAPGQYRAEIDTNLLENGLYHIVLNDGTSVQTASLLVK